MVDKKIYRSNRNKVLCGVFGGIGEYFNIDPVILRLIWVILVLFAPGRHLFHSVFGVSAIGVSIVIYILAAVIIPSGTKN